MIKFCRLKCWDVIPDKPYILISKRDLEGRIGFGFLLRFGKHIFSLYKVGSQRTIFHKIRR